MDISLVLHSTFLLTFSRVQVKPKMILTLVASIMAISASDERSIRTSASRYS